jgi:drug/metabolite transporter (DMT)-like permease
MKQPIVKENMLLVLLAAIWGTSFSMIKIGVTEIGPATLTAVLLGIMPLFTVILAHYFLEDEPFSSRSMAGIALGFSGLLGFLAWEGTGNEFLVQFTVLVASLSYAAVTIFVRRRVTASGLMVATGALIAASIFSLVLAFAIENPTEMGWNINAVLPMVLLGLFPTALASLMYFRLVRSLGVTRFAQVNYIIPVFGSIIGVYYMNELTEWRMWLALALVLSGLFLVHGARREIPRVV